ncbi:MAG: hypothetical protein IKI00_04595, partial [Bacteroidales bacterium]|nr:hypothetical protein [Bacteroidales bacterium]
MIKRIILAVLSLPFVLSCTVRCPENAAKLGEMAVLSPDYTDVTIPFNLSPLKFSIANEGDRFVTRLAGSTGGELVFGGKDVEPGLKEWRSLLQENKGADLNGSIFVKRNGKWMELDGFTIHVA